MTLEGSFPTKASEAGIFTTLFVVFMFATWFVLTLAILCVMEVSFVYLFRINLVLEFVLLDLFPLSFLDESFMSRLTDALYPSARLFDRMISFTSIAPIRVCLPSFTPSDSTGSRQTESTTWLVRQTSRQPFNRSVLSSLDLAALIRQASSSQ